MAKLNDMQCILLSHASQHDDGLLLPPPERFAAAPERVAKTIASLLKAGLAEERKTTIASHVFREDGEQRFAVIITDAGRAAIGVESVWADDSELTAVEQSIEQATPEVTPHVLSAKTKSAKVLDLLWRDEGATLDELFQATGWLPHTTRAALTGLRKKGHVIDRGKRGDVTCYHISEVAHP